jgi:hypothetical protein
LKEVESRGFARQRAWEHVGAAIESGRPEPVRRLSTFRKSLKL